MFYTISEQRSIPAGVVFSFIDCFQVWYLLITFVGSNPKPYYFLDSYAFLILR